MPKVSVIVPVYKVEAYLSRCIDSILTQTFTDFELILVDDGSPDKSGTICEEYAARDSRIVVVHKENGGVSSARNAGLDVAQGKYIMFCDADDELTVDALNYMLNEVVEQKGQMVVGGVENLLIDTEKNYIQKKTATTREYRSVELDGGSEMLLFWSENNMLSCWAKLYVKQIIDENHVRFNTDLVVLEDYDFVIAYLASCTRICMIPDYVYRWYSYAGSSYANRRSRIDFYDDVIMVTDRFANYLSGLQSAYINDFLVKSVYPSVNLACSMLWGLPYNSLKERLKKYGRIKKAISEAHFQKMLNLQKEKFGPLEYFSLKHKLITGLLTLRVLRKICLPEKLN